MAAPEKKNMTRLAVLFTLCGVLLLILAVGGLIVRCRTLEHRLDEIFMESMMSHTEESGKDAQQLIDDTQILLEDTVQLLETDGRPLEKQWVDPLLRSVNLAGAGWRSAIWIGRTWFPPSWGARSSGCFSSSMRGPALWAA